jgi:hypothetical protein
MQRKGRKYELVAAAAKAGRDHRAKGENPVSDGRGLQYGAPGAQQGVARGLQREATPVIEVSDADYRTVHLPCAALEERAQPIKKGGGKPGN